MNTARCDKLSEKRAAPVSDLRDDLRKRIMSMDETAHCSVILVGRIFLVSGSLDVFKRLRANKRFSVFCIDDELVYDNFFGDFGPLNLAMVYRYCLKLNRKLDLALKTQRKIVHYCGTDPHKRANAAFLCGAYQIIYLHRTGRGAWTRLKSRLPYAPFRDAALGPNHFPLTLESCLEAVEKAFKLRWLDFDSFSCDEYEFYERVENGDLNWMIPRKFIAFCGPHNTCRVENGHPFHSPEVYFEYFRKHKVTDIVRLNKRMYDAAKFTRNGFNHHDLYFLDGSTPTVEIMLRFLDICEKADGAIAVHCKAGLGRTGTLIGCYMIKHFGFTAEEAIAWLRICRPGSVIGVQQSWLKENEPYLRSLTERTVTMKAEQTMEAPLLDGSDVETQGDCLNRIKANRKLRMKVEL